MTATTPQGSPKSLARTAGVFYLLTIVTGFLSLAMPGRGAAANLAASACYVGVTVLFYRLFKPVSAALSLIAAGVSLLGCVYGVLNTFHIAPWPINNLAFFGVYCLLVGYLIVRSAFLPGVLGVLMAIGGLGWLTFAAPALSKQITPWNMLPGVLAEGVLTLWLLIAGVNAERWNAQAGRSPA